MLCAARSAVFFRGGWYGYPWPLESPAALRQAAWRPLTVPWDLPGLDLRPFLDDHDAPADDPVDQQQPDRACPDGRGRRGRQRP